MKAAVVGSGAWGTALAIQLCKNGHDVTMWTFEKELIPQMENERLNIRLSGVKLPPELKISGDYACIQGCKLVVMASPSFPARTVAKAAAPYIDDDAVLVSVTKGLEDGSFKRMSEVVAEATGRDVVVLTGPSHAEEVALGVPTGCLAASEQKELAEFVQDAFMSDTFRVYTSPDPVGAELGAALKNVIALCAGITDGLGCGDNTKAMLMTRGLTETARLGLSLGAKKETFTGLSGIGDLIVTCTSMHSRNRRAGILIGQGKDPQTAMQEVGAVVEGYYAAKAAYELGKRQGIDMPITAAAYKVLYEGADVKTAFSGLMNRGRKAESEDAGWL
ncbi:MAG: NAD(P)-dependent glycerol-3-phosphate dehydrogenase [Oscillospiraceae bacterium]|nr:NAD(P)-dependent glycerol-3-phosphate dehydrogenase [Oscillospiraceae bacterium]MBQ7130333.1 NAD(P)-dependent glycerol-3-phosphate dehydrogenase [Oscillospiraceae bacterium]